MYLTLFELAALAAPMWLLLILLPTWRGTRWLARSSLVPVFLSIIYLIGITLIVREFGFGFMRDFGNVDGVLRLLRREDVAIIAWIHILAFDQLVGLFIFRDNMHHRYVPVVVQSVILFLTFMLGPIGFLLYYLIRFARTRSMWGNEPHLLPAPPQ